MALSFHLQFFTLGHPVTTVHSLFVWKEDDQPDISKKKKYENKIINSRNGRPDDRYRIFTETFHGGGDQKR